MRYIIIGCSAAGISAAQEIRKYHTAAEIVIVTEEHYKAYGRPLISYYLKDRVKEEDIYYKDKSFYTDNFIYLLTGKRVVDINLEQKYITLNDDKKIDYDRLLIATGSKPFVPHIENAEGKANIFTFMNMESAKQIKEYAKPEMKAVVIGGGLIGMKAAEGLKKLCSSVTVLELAERILPTILDTKASSLVRKHSENNGIDIITGDTAVQLNGSDKVESLTLKSGKTLPCDILIMAVGVRPNTELAQKAGCLIDKGIVIDHKMQTNIEDIYAAGDCALTPDVVDGKNKVIALWPTAVQQGKIAGGVMAGADTRYEGSFAMNAIDLFGLHMLTAGVIGGEEEGYEVKIIINDKGYRRFSIKDGLLKGFMLVGDIERGGLYTTVIRERLPLSGLDEEIFENPEFISFDRVTKEALFLNSDAIKGDIV
ncbi:MAG: FAD-dependent oxidoreductase [Oscillospiraceae bacterium]|jgi:NAD(P)H-nitrite reductase large subunit|nr:FAD-dependent oxidoreductase [Oscillospiraceae bacterium]